MANKGRNTWRFSKGAYILSGSGVVGPKEGQGPIGSSFDKVYNKIEAIDGSWEKAEGQMQTEAINLALNKGKLAKEDIDFLLGGDLLDQITVTNFTAKTLGVPFLGLYNACATMTEAMALGSMLIENDYSDNLLVVTSSHNAASERQYRNPTELGAQRPQTAQWTVTGAGSMILSSQGGVAKIVAATIGKVLDYEMKDPNQMGAAMAPAVFDTLKEHFRNTQTTSEDYDLILSGDLGYHGHKILMALLEGEGLSAGPQFQDTGIWIYDESQDVHSGGSGAGCSSSVWSSYLLKEITKGKYQHILLAGSGALLSPCSLQQGNSIPGICHVVELVRE